MNEYGIYFAIEGPIYSGEMNPGLNERQYFVEGTYPFEVLVKIKTHKTGRIQTVHLPQLIWMWNDGMVKRKINNRITLAEWDVRGIAWLDSLNELDGVLL